MQTFKNIIKSVICFLLVLFVFSVALIEPLIQFEIGYYSDGKSRDALAGQIDFLFIGDSDALSAFNPAVFDETTGMNSYNLSGSMLNTKSERFLIEKEIKRNNIKQVVVQLSYQSIDREIGNEYADGESVTYLRLNNPIDRIKYMTTCVTIDDWLNVYSRSLVAGISSFKSLTTNDLVKCDRSLKGWHANSNKDVSLNEIDAQNLLNSINISHEFSKNSYEGYLSVIDVCKRNNVDICFVILPLSNEFIWKVNNGDDFSKAVKDFCKENDVKVYDFNLLKSKYNILNDRESYVDNCHMSPKGAEAFTKSFSEVYDFYINDKNTNDLFYSSYEEMKKDSPYWEYMD